MVVIKLKNDVTSSAAWYAAHSDFPAIWYNGEVFKVFNKTPTIEPSSLVLLDVLRKVG